MRNKFFPNEYKMLACCGVEKILDLDEYVPYEFIYKKAVEYAFVNNLSGPVVDALRFAYLNIWINGSIFRSQGFDKLIGEVMEGYAKAEPTASFWARRIAQELPEDFSEGRVEGMLLEALEALSGGLEEKLKSASSDIQKLQKENERLKSQLEQAKQDRTQEGGRGGSFEERFPHNTVTPRST